MNTQRIDPSELAADPRWRDASWVTRGWTPTYRSIKRASDVTISCIGLVVLTFALPFIAIAIKRNTPGPIFYRQERVGRGGTPFLMIKFRSMGVDAERDGARYSEAGDPRITRVGAVLRKTRLDELPQLYNVLKGEMSIIGPRPERPENIEMLEQAIPGFSIRTAIQPGLTGWAQVCVPYANTVELTALKFSYDLYYVRHASVWLDAKIYARTVRTMLRLEGL